MLLLIGATLAGSQYRVDGPVVLAADPNAANEIATALEAGRPQTEACLAKFQSSTDSPQFVVHLSRSGAIAPLVEVKAAATFSDDLVGCLRALGRAVVAGVATAEFETWFGVIVPKAGNVGVAAIKSIGGADLVTRPSVVDVRLEGDPKIMGWMDLSVATSTFQRNIESIRACYRRGVGRQASLSGSIVEKLAIAQDGSVSSARATASTLADAETQSCIDSAFLTFRFPPLSRGSLVLVSYPIALAPG